MSTVDDLCEINSLLDGGLFTCIDIDDERPSAAIELVDRFGLTFPSIGFLRFALGTVSSLQLA